MLVWLYGGLNLNQIQKCVCSGDDSDFFQQLIAFLDDSISTSVPGDPNKQLIVPSCEHHTRAVRGMFNSMLD